MTHKEREQLLSNMKKRTKKALKSKKAALKYIKELEKTCNCNKSFT